MVVVSEVPDRAELVRMRVSNIVAKYDSSYLLDIFNVMVQAAISDKVEEVLITLENLDELADGTPSVLQQTQNLLMAYRHLFGLSGPQPIQISWP